MYRPIDEHGEDLLTFYDKEGVEVEESEQITELLKTRELHVEIDGDGRIVSVFDLPPQEQRVVGAWFTFAAAFAAMEADRFHAGTERLVKAMKATGSETMGDLNNFVKEHGHEKVQQLIDEMEASGPHLKAV